MAIFRYKALTETGKKMSGVIDADSLIHAKEKLRKDRVLVTKLSTIQKKKEVGLSASMLLGFTRELKQLLGAGLPLYESLLTIEEKYKRHKTHALFLDLCDRLKGGDHLSTALKAYPKSFDLIYISMVEAGEKTGSLPWVFDQLNQLTEKKQKLKKQLVSAMAYPAFLGVFCFLVVMALLLFVIPSMQELFEGRDLHPLTQMVLSSSQFLQQHFFTLLFLVGGAVFGIITFFKREKNRKNLHQLFQNIPILKTVFMQASLIRFCRSAAILLFGGVPLVTALTTARKVMSHALLEEAIEKAEKHLIEGYSLSSQLKNTHFPPLVSRMLATAEETGKFPEMLQSLSDIYDQELERSLTYITTFLQPVLLLILGGVIGLVILSILLPLTDVSSLIGN